MKKIKLLSLLLSISVMVSACSGTVSEIQQTQPQPTANSDSTIAPQGTTENIPIESEQPITVEISTAEDLVDLSANYIANNADATQITYVLTNDIDMSGIENFTPIACFSGYGADDIREGFTSTFDGKGYTIKNLTITSTENQSAVGLFASVAKPGVVKNLNIENITINSVEYPVAYTGGLAGLIYGVVSDCNVQGTVNALSSAGGFTGDALACASIDNCTANVDISGQSAIGGFVGTTSYNAPSISNCASFGTVTAKRYQQSEYLINTIGGFVGMSLYGNFYNCHAENSLVITETAQCVGAFAGNVYPDYVLIFDCSYSPAHAGNWDIIDTFKFKKTYGNYEPYVFTPNDNWHTDNIASSTGIETEKIVATSKDNRYFIYESDSWGEADGGETEYTLKDTQTDKEKLLGKVWLSRNSGAGFFQNGDVYTFDEHNGLKVFDTDMDNMTAVFDSQTNFPCGENIDGNGTERYIFAIRRDPEKMDYIVIYGEFNNADGTPKKYPYRVGLLDANGNLTQTNQLPVEFDTTDFYAIHMFKSGETEIEFYAEMKDKELFRVRFDYANEVYTQIK